MEIKFIKNREGDLIPFDMSRIERAIEKAAEAAKYSDVEFLPNMVQKIMEETDQIHVKFEGAKTFHIEEIQERSEEKRKEKKQKKCLKIIN
jgi:hypothetical protein